MSNLLGKLDIGVFCWGSYVQRREAIGHRSGLLGELCPNCRGDWTKREVSEASYVQSREAVGHRRGLLGELCPNRRGDWTKRKFEKQVMSKGVRPLDIRKACWENYVQLAGEIGQRGSLRSKLCPKP